MMVTLK